MRPAFDALFDINDALAEVIVRATEPTLAAIKLAWWREQLEKLDVEAAPAEPRLQAAAAELLPRGITGRELANLVDERGEALFSIAARLLGAERNDATIGTFGRLFARVDIVRRGRLELDAGSPPSVGGKIPRQVRPLTGLAALAARDLRRGGPPFEPEATPGRSWALIWHRISGRY